MAETIDFREQVERLWRAHSAGGARPAIWGGTIAVDALERFLKAWRLPRADMPWCLWEHASRITLDREKWPERLDLLERGRVFGEGGDLALRRDSALRRDGALWRWSYIGPSGAQPPAGFQAEDYWAAGERPVLHEYSERVLLWGKWRADGRWYDDRVARADLVYPGLAGQERVSLRYRSYMAGGQVEFVWLLALEGANEHKPL